MPGTYKCGNPNNTYWQIFGGDTTFTGWGATRDDVILDYEGAGKTFRITNGRVSNLVITNFNCGSGTAAVNVFGGGILSNCVVTCGRSYGVNPGDEAALVVDCEISHIDGVGATYGAAIGNNSASACGNLLRCFVHDNAYPGNSTGGAGGYLKYGEVNSCVFSNNISAAWGGGLLVVNSVRILNSTFYENSSASVGGGAICFNGGEAETNVVENCTFVGNKTSANNVQGGAIHSKCGFLTVSNCSFTANSAAAGVGGAIYVCSRNYTSQTAGLAVYDCAFTNNMAKSAAGIYLESYSDGMAVSGCTFVGNCATNADGAAIRTVGPNPNGKALRLPISNCLFKDNYAAGAGGAVAGTSDGYGYFGPVFSFNDCTFDGNVAKLGAGTTCWGAYTNCVFVNNISSNYLDSTELCSGGAAVYPNSYGWQNARVPEATNDTTFVNCVFSNNVAHGKAAGAIIAKIGRLTMLDCRVEDNCNDTAGGSGGAIFVGNTISKVFIDRCALRRNLGRSALGGAIFLQNGVTETTIRNSLFVTNVTTASGGGAISMSSNCLLENNTFVQNSCTGSGGALYCPTATGVAVRNCLFNHNATWREAADADIDSVTVKSTCVFSSASNQDCFNAANGNIVATDPLFADAAHGNYSLQGKSPCVNAGLNQDWMTDAFDLDNYTKKPRIIGSAVDIGCYEYRPVPGLTIMFR